MNIFHQNRNLLVKVGMVLALVLIGFIAYINYQYIQRFLESARWVKHTYQVIVDLNAIEASFSEAESAQRGYLLTKNAYYLRLYKKNKITLPKQINALQALVADNAQQKFQIEKLKKLAVNRLDFLQKTLDTAAVQSDYSSKQLQVIMAEGTALSIQFNNDMNKIISAETALLKQRTNIERLESESLSNLILVGNFVALALLVASYWVLRKEIQMRELAQMQSEKQALEAEDLYNHSPFAYHSVDQQGLIIKMNATGLRWLGYREDEVVNKKFHPDLMTEASAVRFHTHAFPLFKKQGWLKDAEFEYIRKDGSSFFASLNATVIYDEQGRYLRSRSSFHDITERKHAELAIQGLNQQLSEKAAELELTNKELESFSYSVSHDLRAPLRAIDGYAHIFEDTFGASLDAEGTRLLGVIRSSSQKMGKLIDDLLMFSRLGRKAIASREVNMNQLVDDIWQEMHNNPETKLPILHKMPLFHCYADPVLLKQVVFNLLSNAVKYSSKQAHPEIQISALETHDEVIYSIKDNGVGFDMNYYHKLFGVFQRLHRENEFSGTGVGLAIVARVINRHGGRVWAEGVINQGSVFSFSLPKGAR